MVENTATKVTIDSTYGAITAAITAPRKGDIYYVMAVEGDDLGNHTSRPMVIVSNDHLNACLVSVTAVPITSKKKPPMRNHVQINTGVDATACCENIKLIPKSRLGSFMKRCTDEEIAEIDKAISYSLGMDKSFESSSEKRPSEDYSELYRKAKAESEVYKDLYNSLLDRITGAKR